MNKKNFDSLNEMMYNSSDTMSPIFDEYQPPVFIPKFPDYSSMSCDELQVAISELTQTLMTSRFVYELRVAYEQALSSAQDEYILKCRRKQTPLPPAGCTYDDDFNLICTEPEIDDMLPIRNPPALPIFVDDINSPIKTKIADSQSKPTFIDDTKAAVPALPTKPVSKNLKPFIYAGLGIVAILIVARVLSKKG